MEPWRGTLPMYRSWIRDLGRDILHEHGLLNENCLDQDRDQVYAIKKRYAFFLFIYIYICDLNNSLFQGS
jgi:hypothetical protein